MRERSSQCFRPAPKCSPPTTTFGGADDIFYERFPDELTDNAPRIWHEDGAYMAGRKGKNLLPADFSRVLM
jgi:hypothetical protein